MFAAITEGLRGLSTLHVMFEAAKPTAEQLQAAAEAAQTAAAAAKTTADAAAAAAAAKAAEVAAAAKAATAATEAAERAEAAKHKQPPPVVTGTVPSTGSPAGSSTTAPVTTLAISNATLPVGGTATKPREQSPNANGRGRTPPPQRPGRFQKNDGAAPEPEAKLRKVDDQTTDELLAAHLKRK